MNKINKVRKGEVKIYKGMTYVAVPEIKEDHCTGCCFYNEGSCLIRDPDHVDFPDCHDSGMIWMQKEINISDIKEKAIKLAIDAMKPIPICSSPCYSISDNRSPEEKHEEEMRFFPVEDHNSAIVLPKGTIRRLTGRDLKWEDDPISLKSVIEGLPHVDIEFYKQKIINFVKWI